MNWRLTQITVLVLFGSAGCLLNPQEEPPAAPEGAEQFGDDGDGRAVDGDADMDEEDLAPDDGGGTGTDDGDHGADGDGDPDVPAANGEFEGTTVPGVVPVPPAWQGGPTIPDQDDRGEEADAGVDGGSDDAEDDEPNDLENQDG